MQKKYPAGLKYQKSDLNKKNNKNNTERCYPSLQQAWTANRATYLKSPRGKRTSKQSINQSTKELR